MQICLKTCSKQRSATQVKLHLTERLPFYIISDCTLVCDYSVQSYPGYYLLELNVVGEVPTQCQRCLETFQYDYTNHTEIAICGDEKTAELLMESYECIVYSQTEINLSDIVTDELHLYVPEKHLDLTECNKEMCNKVVNIA